MRPSVILRAASYERELRRVQVAALIAPIIVAVVIVCAVLGAGCYAHTPTPSCAQNPAQPQCPAPIHDEKR